MGRKPFNPLLIKPDAYVPREPAGPISVSQLTAMVKRAIETELPPTVHVTGEISNFKRHGSGHWYFTLKDTGSEVSCVMWRSAAAKVKFDVTDGMAVIATGGVEVFERAGRYQLYVRKIEPRGIGSLELAFRQLQDKLEREGLFDPAKKKPLPPYPGRIAVVTSPTGAAVTDILRTIRRRYPCVAILIAPVKVQGPGAARQIADAIDRINRSSRRLGGVDVIIVGRGGGSIEDLWAFNEEVVARAISASAIPVISAVGHEVDVTIADLVADVRAQTPTAAAELAVPVLADVLADLTARGLRLARVLRQLGDLAAARFGAVLQRRSFGEPLSIVRRGEQSLDRVAGELQDRVLARLPAARRRVESAEAVVGRIAPHAFLRHTGQRLAHVRGRLDRLMAHRLMAAGRTVEDLSRRLLRHAPDRKLPVAGERLRRIETRLHAVVGHRIALALQCVGAKADLLQAMSYKRVLARGFSITRFKRGRQVVRGAGQVQDGDRLVTETGDGEFESEVRNQSQLELFDEP